MENNSQQKSLNILQCYEPQDSDHSDDDSKHEDDGEIDKAAAANNAAVSADGAAIQKEEGEEEKEGGQDGLTAESEKVWFFFTFTDTFKINVNI